ncbi:uncharacterized protein LOC143298528 isoform X2 [Babylonia areolata]|uniref:uncharacterized protein LOC143298528 isoform X2 n=1 Tax=Babylonia areolata TaxID=304850 RepID=UPI003FD116F2
MAVSHNSDLPRVQDPRWQLNTGEEVSLHMNSDVFLPDGRLRGGARFAAERDCQLFTLSWPRLEARCVSTLSRWRLVITQATVERIASFSASTAENLGANRWEVVMKAVEQCRNTFNARLLSMSSREIVFAHVDQKSADKMKDSNEMVDIMNSLLADVEFLFRDIMVDWKVKVTPVTLSLSYQPVEEGAGGGGQSGSLVFTDSDSPPVVKSSASKTSSYSEDLPPHFHRLLDVIAAESRKTQDALAKMAADSMNRHRIVCQKIEELKSSVQHLDPQYTENHSGVESDNYLSDNVQPCTTGMHDSIPSAELFEGPRIPDKQPGNTHSAARTEPPQKSQLHGEDSSCQTHAAEPDTQGGQHHDQGHQKAESTSQEDSTRACEAVRETLSGCDLENWNLDEALQRAYLHDVTSPKAKSFYTVLCLDVSESMRMDGAFDEMKHFVNKFIDGVEDIVTTSGVEENIGVVTFGTTSNIVQNLTNDFSRVRDAIDRIELGGRTPFVQALMVAMAAFVHKAGVISISGMYDVKPRIIFLSDGYATENYDDGGTDVAYNKMHVRSAVTKLMLDFATKQKYQVVHPVIYIPVGGNPDREMLKTMAEVGNGQFMETKDVQKLCGYFLVQETIGKTLAVVRKSNDQPSEERLRAVVQGLNDELDEDQKDEVVRTVMTEMEKPSSQTRIRRRGSNLEDTYEKTDQVNAGEMLPLGTRVVRGPDWHWNKQDGGGPGTVIAHSNKTDDTVYVFWDFTNSYNSYQYGPKSGYDVWKTDDHPRFMEGQEIEIGMTVQKGPDWSCQHVDSLSHVRTGIVIRKSRSKRKLMVRWNNAEFQVVRWGAEDKFDVMFCDPTDIPQPAALEYQSANTTASPADDRPDVSSNKTPCPTADAPEFENGQWQWRDEHMNWNDYSPQDSAHIEKSYKRRSSTTCIIVREGKNRRIMFRRMTEKIVDGGTECSVRRIPV